MMIYAGAINRDHVHMLIGIPPSLSVSKAVQFLKRKEFTQDAGRVSTAEEEILGAAFVGERILGRFKWKRNRRSLESVYRKSEAK